MKISLNVVLLSLLMHCVGSKQLNKRQRHMLPQMCLTRSDCQLLRQICYKAVTGSVYGYCIFQSQRAQRQRRNELRHLHHLVDKFIRFVGKYEKLNDVADLEKPSSHVIKGSDDRVKLESKKGVDSLEEYLNDRDNPTLYADTLPKEARTSFHQMRQKRRRANQVKQKRDVDDDDEDDENAEGREYVATESRIIHGSGTSSYSELNEEGSYRDTEDEDDEEETPIIKPISVPDYDTRDEPASAADNVFVKLHDSFVDDNPLTDSSEKADELVDSVDSVHDDENNIDDNDVEDPTVPPESTTSGSTTTAFLVPGRESSTEEEVVSTEAMPTSTESSTTERPLAPDDDDGEEDDYSDEFDYEYEPPSTETPEKNLTVNETAFTANKTVLIATEIMKLITPGDRDTRNKIRNISINSTRQVEVIITHSTSEEVKNVLTHDDTIPVETDRELVLRMGPEKEYEGNLFVSSVNVSRNLTIDSVTDGTPTTIVPVIKDSEGAEEKDDNEGTSEPVYKETSAVSTHVEVSKSSNTAPTAMKTSEKVNDKNSPNIKVTTILSIPHKQESKENTQQSGPIKQLLEKLKKKKVKMKKRIGLVAQILSRLKNQRKKKGKKTIKIGIGTLLKKLLTKRLNSGHKKGKKWTFYLKRKKKNHKKHNYARVKRVAESILLSKLIHGEDSQTNSDSG